MLVAVLALAADAPTLPVAEALPQLGAERDQLAARGAAQLHRSAAAAAAMGVMGRASVVAGRCSAADPPRPPAASGRATSRSACTATLLEGPLREAAELRISLSRGLSGRCPAARRRAVGAVEPLTSF